MLFEVAARAGSDAEWTFLVDTRIDRCARREKKFAHFAQRRSVAPLLDELNAHRAPVDEALALHLRADRYHA